MVLERRVKRDAASVNKKKTALGPEDRGHWWWEDLITGVGRGWAVVWRVGDGLWEAGQSKSRSATDLKDVSTHMLINR